MDNWITVCSREDLVPHTGICAKVKDQQVAIFYCQRSETLYAISNYDPIGMANVISRGIIGSIQGEPCVASPLYKQHFNLKTGICVEEPTYQLMCFKIRTLDDQVQIQLPLVA
ncbi:nitrite reductase small subunit [Vibrio sp. 10N.286.49.B3]|uniref:nitrite reductase small subunit NirD n=1 Tax=Vibrio sp. 10N.286.49.B3 TaxID=1880855 RepID=UPI000C8528DC|nr:nitrite reductase small subunit NirD [Vibrio sp. 10N.286.49.B3]PMH43155.1 nitrite reductase small subunit [Vibrio sp. 10N.286.49.B3]